MERWDSKGYGGDIRVERWDSKGYERRHKGGEVGQKGY